MIIFLYGLFPLKSLGAAGESGGPEPTGNEEYTAHGAAELWLAVEQGLVFGLESKGQFSDSVNEFVTYMDGFLSSPVYRIFSPSQEEVVKSIVELTGSFKAALTAGQREDALKLVIQIRRDLIRWQRVDGEIANSINDAYFHLIFVFAALMVVTALGMWQLYRALLRAWKRERQGAIFSREMMLALEAERSRIARELHDTVAQDLRYLTLRVGKIVRVSDSREREEICAEVAAAQEGLIGRVRSICNDLVPPDFRFQGLPDALRRLCYDYGNRTGIDCRIDIEDALRLDPMSEGMQLQCFRIVQEALTNIEKHAEASEAVVVVRSMGIVQGSQRVFISVSDDGKGFDAPVFHPEKGESGHLGIRGMYERAAILRGHLVIESEKGEGTMVRIEIPVEG